MPKKRTVYSPAIEHSDRTWPIYSWFTYLHDLIWWFSWTMWVYERVASFQAPSQRVSEGLWHRHCQIWDLRGRNLPAEGRPMIAAFATDFFSTIPLLKTSSFRIKGIDYEIYMKMYDSFMIIYGRLKQLQVGQGIQGAKETSNVCS